MMLGGIEAGGTKFVLGIGASPEAIAARHVIPTRDPATTLEEAAAWFEGQGGVRALGLASFGPLELDRSSPDWGRIKRTPKPGWSNCDITGILRDRLAVPVGLDTDVNAAALAEYRARANGGCASLVYLTIGTGIGGGAVIEGHVLHGAAHPEMGHVIPRRHPADRDFAGICPHHGDCLEGLASGPAIERRWGCSLSDLPAGHIAHEIIADLLGQACHTIFATLAVETIVLGGGVSRTPGLVEAVEAAFRARDAGYLPGSDRYRIEKPLHGEDSGLRGALLLAQRCAGGGDAAP